MGRARAWLRLALMQKRLADYLRILLEHREETLEEYFEPHALMLNEEAVIITGLLVGLNVVDCNLCVKVSSINRGERGQAACVVRMFMNIGSQIACSFTYFIKKQPPRKNILE